jgi:hypothetical protein
MNAHKPEMMLNNRQEPSMIEVGYRPRGPLKNAVFWFSLVLMGTGLLDGFFTSLSENYFIKNKTAPREPPVMITDAQRRAKLGPPLDSKLGQVKWAILTFYDQHFDPDPYGLRRGDREDEWARYRDPEAHYANAFYCLLGGTGLYLASRKKELYRRTE